MRIFILSESDQETEIVPGIRAIPAAGHTPGHMAVAISSGDEQLLLISDAALHPIHLGSPTGTLSLTSRLNKRWPASVGLWKEPQPRKP